MQTASNSLSSIKKIALFVILVAAVGIGIATWNNLSKPKDNALAATGILPTPRPLPAFSLTRADHKTLSRKDLRGKWSLLFFGYTHCPDICPTTLAELAQARQLLTADSKVLDETQFIFVSVDPARDTPESLRDYVHYFSPDFIAATGSTQQLADITLALDIKYSRGEASVDGYAVNHSSAVVLIDPQVRYYARLKAPHYGEEVRQHFLTLRKHYGEENHEP
jgi:protein SCO1/2